MKNPFSKILQDDKTTDNSKRDFHKLISKKAWDISKKVPFGKCKLVDVQELEQMYKDYFKKFPDKKAQESSVDRIKKLKIFAK